MFSHSAVGLSLACGTLIAFRNVALTAPNLCLTHGLRVDIE